MGSSILPAALAAAIILGGTGATYWFDDDMPLLPRLAAGLCIGLAALGLIALPLATRFGLTTWIVGIAAAATALFGALPAFARDRRRWSGIEMPARDALRLPGRAAAIAASVAAIAALWAIARQVMFSGPDGIYTGVSHNIGDLPFHLTVTNRFVFGNNLPPEHPSFAGVGFTYPFLTDFLAAIAVRAGATASGVFVWSTFLLLLATAVLLHRWTWTITGDRTAAIAAPLIALLSGGLGWWRFLEDAWRHERGAWALLLHLTRDYTITSDGEFRWGNLVTSLLVTQRGLLLGLPLALIVFSLWWPAIAPTEIDATGRQRRIVAAGVIAGMLPLVHAHSFAVVVGAAACIALLSADRWSWLPFFAWALALGLPQLWWIAQSSGVEGRSFVAWSVGWDHGSQNVALFWLKNTGLLIPFAVLALLWRGSRPLVSRPLLLFYLPFTLCFIVPNLVRLAPWIWDNIKVLAYWFVASVPLVALVFSRLWHNGRWQRAAAVAALVCLTFAGALDLWRVASGAFRYRVFDAQGIQFATRVAAATEPDALILHAPVPNHPVALTGRRSLMGYPGHVWSHGLDPGPREADIRRMYAGGPESAALLRRYGIRYVVVGPRELFDLGANEPFFRRYATIAEAAGYSLYRVAGERQ